jgi:DNA polymerase-3 subunit alpha
MKPKFISQAAAKGHPRKKAGKNMEDWEAFAGIPLISRTLPAAWIAYQTAYLKANYPAAEYMAAII